MHSTWNLQSIEQSQRPSKATNMFACHTWSIMKQISKCRPQKQICKRRDSGNDSQRRKHWRRRTGWSFQLSFNCNNCDQINFLCFFRRIDNPFQFCLYRRFQMQIGWKPSPRRYSLICPKEIAQRRAQVAELESAKVTWTTRKHELLPNVENGDKIPTETRLFWWTMEHDAKSTYSWIYTYYILLYTIDIQRFRFRIDPDSKKYDVHKRIFSS